MIDAADLRRALPPQRRRPAGAAEPYSSPPRTRRQYQIELTAERLSGAVPLPRLRAMTRMLVCWRAGIGN